MVKTNIFKPLMGAVLPIPDQLNSRQTLLNILQIQFLIKMQMAANQACSAICIVKILYLTTSAFQNQATVNSQQIFSNINI